MNSKKKKESGLGRVGGRGGSYRAIAEQLSEDIDARRFRRGDPLPSVQELSRRFGVGEFSMRHALRLLSKQGFLELKPHVGAVVREHNARAAPFRIAYYGIGIGNYSLNATLNALRRRFTAAGCDFVVVSPDFPDEGEVLDLSAFERELDRGVDYVIAGIGLNSELKLLDRRKIPYAVLDGFVGNTERFPKADAHFTWDDAEAQRAIIAALNRAGVKRVLEVDFQRSYEKSLSRRLSKEGFSVRRIWTEVSVKKDGVSTRSLMQSVYRDISTFLRRIRSIKTLPDAIVFMDDFAARGGLAAILEAGYRVPEDIKVVSHSNADNEPFFPRRLTRWELDFAMAAGKVADWTLLRLKGKRPAVPKLKVRFVRGKTL